GLLAAALPVWSEPMTPVPAPEPTLTPVVVKGARVNLRAKPDKDAEPVGKAAEGSVLQAKSIREEWVELVPPESVELWVHRDFVKDQVVTAEKLYIRTGRSINHAVVGTIAPTPAASVWVSRKLVELQMPGAVANFADTTAKTLPPPVAISALATNAGAAVAVPTGAVVAATVFVPEDIQNALVPLEGQGKAVQMEGVLRVVGFSFSRQPSRFRLVRLSGRSVETLCYVRGNSDQLNGLLDQLLRIQGRQYFVNNAEYPVLVPDRISPRAAP
ncbi:MAG: SH3 domain-containing protein, partial [Kiritimatiellaeota bacterium]|nr:SH3 domain-containing protein [Kiritimatiellota bacterium]